METVRTLAEYLDELLKRNGISASELSRRMGFSSRTSVFRILKDESSSEKQREFLERLEQSRALPLTQEDREALRVGAEVSRIGYEQFSVYQAMEELIMPSKRETLPLHVSRWMNGAMEEVSFSAWMGRIFSSRSVKLLIVGCCSGTLFRAMAEQLGEGRAEHVEITHYIQATGSALVRSLIAIQPVLYYGGYQAYMPGERHGRLFDCDMILAECEDADGTRHWAQAVMPDETRLCCCTLDGEQTYGFLTNLLTTYAAGMKPIKNAFMQPASPADYLKYTEQYREIEKDTALYDIKCDMPINFINADVLLDPVRDGFKAVGFCGEAEREALVLAFHAIQKRRFENFRTKHSPTYTIFNYERMRHFAMTGKQSDHFFAIRPYTPAERVRILSDLREMTRTVPYFTVYFFKRDIEPVYDEIGLYEGKGLLLTKPDTDYRLDGEHAEALITQPELCSSYQRFYLDHLIKECVVGRQETLAILDELIALSRKSA